MWIKLVGGKREAKQLWAEGKPVALIGCNMRVPNPWTVPCEVHPAPYVEKAEMYQGLEASHPKKHGEWGQFLDRPAIDVAWDLMYNNWAFYNTDYERGYYAHYYVRQESTT